MERETKTPGLERPKVGDDRSVQRFLDAVYQTLQTREGRAGNILDRALTARDLVDAGIANIRLNNRWLSGNSSSWLQSAANGVANYSVPPTPTGLTATPAVYIVILQFTDPSTLYANHAYTEIWRSNTNDIGAAVKIGTTTTAFYMDSIGQAGVTRYYWIRFVSTSDKTGPYNATAGTSATTGYVTNADIVPDSTAPGAPTGLTVTGGLKYNTLLWTRPADNDINRFEVYRNSVDNRGTATKIGDANTTIYSDQTTGAWYYWIRAVDSAGNVGAWNATAGTLGTTVQITSGNVSTYIGNATIDDALIVNLNVSKLLAGTISAGNIYLGDTTFELNGPNRLITIKDQQGTPATRIKLGKLGAGASDYGIEIYKSDGSLLLGATGLGVSVVGNTNIASVAADKLTAGTITAGGIYIGATNLLIDGANGRIDVSDGTYTRARLGNLGGGSYGLELKDATGAIIFNSGGFQWSAVTGTGKPADGATTDLSLVATGNCVITGNTVTKSGGVSAWDSDVYSRDSYIGGVFCSAIIGQTNKSLVFGINTDPTTDSDYASVDCAWWITPGGGLDVFEYGSTQSLGLTYTTTDVLSILYDGFSVRYYKNGAIQRTSSTVWTPSTAYNINRNISPKTRNGYTYKCTIGGTSGGTEPTWPTTVGNTVVDGAVTWQCETAVEGIRFFFDSSFYHASAKLTNIRFGPLTQLQQITSSNIVTYIANAAIQSAQIGSLNADVINAGEIRGINVASSSLMTRGSYLTSATTAGDTTIYVKNTADFDASGSAIILDSYASGSTSNNISYTGKTATTLTGCTGVLAHTNGRPIVPGKQSAVISGGDINDLRSYTDVGGGYGFLMTGYIGDGGAVFGTTVTGAGTGVYGKSSSYLGVYGYSITGTGVFGKCYSSGVGVHGMSAGIAVKGESTSAGSYDFYAAGAGTNYGPFTGGHDGVVTHDFTYQPGDIVCDQAIVFRKNTSNAICLNGLSDSPYQENVVGVMVGLFEITENNVPAAMVVKNVTRPDSGTDPEPAVYAFPLEDMQANWKRITFNALGEGLINVCKEGGNINAGDYICSSSTPGKGMRQDDDIYHNYTVARARESVAWEDGDGSIKQIACIYLCG